MTISILSDHQCALVERAMEGRVFLEGPAGDGKTSAIQLGGRVGSVRLGARGALRGSGVMVGVIGEQTCGLRDGDQVSSAVRKVNHRAPR